MKLPFNYDHKTTRVHIWHVRFILPKDETNGRSWNNQMNLSVGGEEIEEAIAAIKTKYPDAKIYGISHGGILLTKEHQQP